MATKAIFSWTFDPFFTFFIDCHVYVPNGMFWGSKSRPHIGDLMMSLFLLWGPPLMTGDGLKMFHFGPNMDGLSTFQIGSEGTKMANLSVFDHLGPFWAHLPLGIISTPHLTKFGTLKYVPKYGQIRPNAPNTVFGVRIWAYQIWSSNCQVVQPAHPLI